MSVQTPEALEIIELENKIKDEQDHAHCADCYPTDKGAIVMTLCGRLARDHGEVVDRVSCERCDSTNFCPICGAKFV